MLLTKHAFSNNSFICTAMSG